MLFNAPEIAALKDKDDLVAQVRTKCSLDKTQAQRDIDAFAMGRQLQVLRSCRGRRPGFAEGGARAAMSNALWTLKQIQTTRHSSPA